MGVVINGLRIVKDVWIGEPMSIGKAIKMVIDEYMRVKDYKNIEKPISWALYQTWKIVDSKEKRRRADDTDNK